MPDEAVGRAAHILTCMLACSPVAVLEQMRQWRAAVGIVARSQVMSGEGGSDNSRRVARKTVSREKIKMMPGTRASGTAQLSKGQFLAVVPECFHADGAWTSNEDLNERFTASSDGVKAGACRAMQ